MKITPSIIIDNGGKTLEQSCDASFILSEVASGEKLVTH